MGTASPLHTFGAPWGRQGTHMVDCPAAIGHACQHSPTPPTPNPLQECGVPSILLQSPQSMFARLVEDTGPHASAALRRLAAEGPRD